MKSRGILFFLLIVLSLAGATAADDDVKVVARWKHLDAVITLYSNGKINDPAGNHSWTMNNRTLILRWKDAKAPGGFWVDTVTISPDGQTFKGTNQLSRPITGTLVKEAPEAQPQPKPDAKPDAKAPAADGPKSEYVRFARLYTMDWGSSLLRDVRLRGAPKRAEMLKAEAFKDAVLRKSADEFKPLADGYFKIWDYKTKKRAEWASWERSGAKTLAILKKEVSEQDYLDLVNDIAEKSKLDITDFVLDPRLNEVLTKAQEQEMALKKEVAKRFGVNVKHGETWKAVLPVARQHAGPKSNDFPLRLGVTYFHNTSQAALTNVTIAITTNSWVEKPARGVTHVVFFERLEANEWVDFPPWLVNKQWKGNAYAEGTDILKCSVYCDQSHIEDVTFDMKKVQGQTLGLVPDKSFTGQYDTKTPWTLPPIPARKLSLTVAGGSWRGDKRLLLIADSMGSYFVGTDTDIATQSSRLIEGTIRDGKVEWVPLYADRGELGQPHWGTIKDGVMDLSYGKDGKAAGNVTLTFAKKKN